MRIIADFHLHSKYSRATSQRMTLEGLSDGAKVKGLNLLGTGDFTFPHWFHGLKEKLEPIENTGLFKYNDIFWMLTTEVNTVYEQEGKIRKVHHVIHASSFDVAEQINKELSKYGNLSIDGRPTLKLMSPELVEILIGISKDTFIIPAHAWTSWFGVMGGMSGFDSIEECYQDQTKYIHALETGMSSDPAMNWRLSALDKFTLVSNSDSHSPWAWRLGREANTFELKKLTYWEIFDAIKNKDKKGFLFTIEVNPNYGKYHFTGHRNCKISLSPEQAKRSNNICPRCKRKLTIGVLQRVEELSNRPEGFVPEDVIPFKILLPLYEIISFVAGTGELYSPKVLKEHDRIIEKLGSELNILLNIPREELLKVTNEKVADAIIKVREGKINYIPGFDGVYGKPVFSEEEYEKIKQKQEIKISAQKSLKDFKGL